MRAIRLGTLLIVLGFLGTPTNSLAQATDPIATSIDRTGKTLRDLAFLRDFYASPREIHASKYNQSAQDLGDCPTSLVLKLN